MVSCHEPVARHAVAKRTAAASVACGAVHRVACVEHEIEHHLLQLHSIAEHGRNRRGATHSVTVTRRDVELAARPDRSRSRTTSLTSTGWRGRFSFRQQRAQAIDHRAGAFVVPDDVVERRPQLARRPAAARSRRRRAACALLRMAVSGWLNSCASAPGQLRPASRPGSSAPAPVSARRLPAPPARRSVMSLTMLRILSPSQRTTHAS